MTAESQSPSPIAAPDDDRRALDCLIILSHAIFPITITLLVFDVRIPRIARDTTAADLLRMPARLLPQSASYALSFAVIGSYWMGHHQRFRRIVRRDGRLGWLNLLLLLFVAFTPFPTSFLSRYGALAPAVIFYAA